MARTVTPNGIRLQQAVDQAWEDAKDSFRLLIHVHGGPTQLARWVERLGVKNTDEADAIREMNDLDITTIARFAQIAFWETALRGKEELEAQKDERDVH